MTIVDTIFKALQPAIPDRVIAGHHADLVAPSFHGFNPKTSELFIGTFGPLGGGWGAKKTEDGVSATVCLNDGDTHNGPNEQAEAKFPIMVERFELIPDSGGAGRHRGGLGIARTTRALTNVTVNTQSERSACPPWGLDGGGEATGNKVAFRVNDGWKDDFPNAKVLVAQLKPGDAFRISSGGGGGYGAPFERPVEDVREDVRQGYVSVKAAAERYGVVVDAETFAVDQAATDKLRAARTLGRRSWPTSFKPIPPTMAPPGGHYSHAVTANGFVFVSGELPIAPDGTKLNEAPFEQQAQQVLDNVALALKGAGSSIDKLTQVRVYVTDIASWPAFNALYAKWAGAARPARCVVPVPQLHYGFKIEIEAVAVEMTRRGGAVK